MSNAHLPTSTRAAIITLMLLAGVAGLGACSSPLGQRASLAGSSFRDLFRERPDDLAQRQPADRLSVARSLNVADMRRDPGATAATPPADTTTALDWSLPDVLARAIEHNLQLKAASLDPQIAEASLSAERAKFEAVFTPSARFRNDDQPSLNTTVANSQKLASLSGGVSVPLRTGGRANIALSGGYTQSDNPFLTTGESYSAGLDASVSLPLLRGSGRAVNTASIKIAGYEADLAMARTKLQVIGVLAQTQRAYWNLVGTRQELVVRQKQLELAQAQLDAARRRVNAGSSPELELTRAESGVASSLNAIITAETNVLTATRALKRLVASPEAPVLGEQTINPTTPPEAQELALDRDRLLTLAQDNRAELVQTELQLLVDALNIDLAQDATRPALTADAAYGYDGLGRNVFGATRTLTRGKFQSWSLGLSGEIPIEGDQAADARLRRAMLSRVQRLATDADQRQSIQQEVLDAIDRVASAWQRIIAAQQSAILAGRTLDGERRQFDAGTRTSTDVLDASARLADAQSQEVRALSDYRLALVDLAVATGTVLGDADIRWDAMPDAGTASDPRAK
jgi:outer membrane protein TolC